MGIAIVWKLKGKYAIHKFFASGKPRLVRCVSNRVADSVYFELEGSERMIDFVHNLEFLPDELQGESWETVKLYLAL